LSKAEEQGEDIIDNNFNEVLSCLTVRPRFGSADEIQETNAESKPFQDQSGDSSNCFSVRRLPDLHASLHF